MAGTPRSHTERRAARRAALAAAKTDHAQRLALADATAVISPDGTAALTYRPGTYQVRRRALVTTTPIPIDRDDDWDRALAALTDTTESALDCLDSHLDPGVDSGVDDDHGSGVDLLDPPPGESGRESRADLRQSTHPRSSSTPGVDPDHDLETGSTPRTLNDLRDQLQTAIGDGTVDPGSAESIRRTLRCSAARARQLRDENSGGQR